MKRAWMLGAFEQQQPYTLVAAVLHHGQGLGRGHYTAVCKVRQQQWIHWDDSSHRLITEAEALHMFVRARACLCVYRVRLRARASRAAAHLPAARLLSQPVTQLSSLSQPVTQLAGRATPTCSCFSSSEKVCAPTICPRCISRKSRHCVIVYTMETHDYTMESADVVFCVLHAFGCCVRVWRVTVL